MGRGAKAIESDTFSKSGAELLNPVCWNNSYHRTAVVSCLVKAVPTMQRDNAKKRKPLANPWWESFGFSLHGTLINRADGSIYGAVYKYNHYKSYQKAPHLGKPPSYVIAFRGTMRSSVTLYSDLKQDLRCGVNSLSHGRRFDNAIQAIKNVLDYPDIETASVWLAGHSLGAGIALLAGKTMARSGFPLETYAFNPPHSALPLEYLFDSDILKGGVRMVRSFFKTTVAPLIDLQIQEDPRTRAWTPNLYVNPEDPICSEYIGDSKQKNMPIVSFRSRFFGRRTPSSPSDFPGEPIQLLSSADITVNKNVTASFKIAHGLKQWWERDPARREKWEIQRIRPSI